MCIASRNSTHFPQVTNHAPKAPFEVSLSAVPVSAHKHLFYEGDARTHIYFIESGWVKLYRTLINGQRQIVGFANAGAILGMESDVEHCNSCESITDLKIRIIPHAKLSEMLVSNPQLAGNLLNQLGHQLGAAQSQLATIGIQSAEQKIATFLLSIARLSGAGESEEFDLPMRRGEMAEFLGLRLETVSRKMSDFQKRGWIQLVSMYHCKLKARRTLQTLADGGDVMPSALTQ